MTKGRIVDGKVVIVTGGGRGIGREVALLLGREGAKVVVNDVGGSLSGDGTSLAPADDVAQLIVTQGGKAIANGGSIAARGDVEAIVADAIRTFGRIDCVVNTAGILRDRVFHKMNDEEWHAVIDVHLHGSYNISRAAAAHFREQESGSLVHFTSTAGLIGAMGQANYAAAKMGIVGLSRSIAIDMARFHVRSNCISPFAWGRMLESASPKTAKEIVQVDRIKQMKPERVAPLAVYLASDRAADVTGQIFVVRNNEILVMSQPRPIRSVARTDGWTPASIADHASPCTGPGGSSGDCAGCGEKICACVRSVNSSPSPYVASSTMLVAIDTPCSCSNRSGSCSLKL